MICTKCLYGLRFVLVLVPACSVGFSLGSSVFFPPQDSQHFQIPIRLGNCVQRVALGCANKIPIYLFLVYVQIDHLSLQNKYSVLGGLTTSISQHKCWSNPSLQPKYRSRFHSQCPDLMTKLYKYHFPLKKGQIPVPVITCTPSGY